MLAQAASVSWGSLACRLLADLLPRGMSAFEPLLGVDRTSVGEPLNEYMP